MKRKKFIRQDYFRYKKLGIKWRKPKGRQSKLRLGKKGAGIKPRVGRKTPSERFIIVNNVSELEKTSAKKILIGRNVGNKKALIIAEEAKKRNIEIVNRKRLKQAGKIKKKIELKKEMKSKKKEEAKKQKEEVKEKEANEENKEKVEAKEEKIGEKEIGETKENKGGEKI